MRLVSLLGSIAVSTFALVAACGGATETELFGGASGSAPSASGGASSSGDPTSSDGASSGGASSSGGSSGASGSSGSSGSSGASGSSGSSGTPGGKACGSDDDCDSGEYCKLAACAPPGECVKVFDDEPAPTLAPVCGCNGITYWNADIAAGSGMSVGASGPCSAGKGKKCAPNKGCPDGARCALDVGKASACLQAPSGICWGLPEDCPKGEGGGGKSCVTLGPCGSLCSAIDAQKPFYKIGSCN